MDNLKAVHPRFERSCEPLAVIYPAFENDHSPHKTYTSNHGLLAGLQAFEAHVRVDLRHGAQSMLCSLDHCYVRNSIIYLTNRSALVPMYETIRGIDLPYVDVLRDQSSASAVNWIEPQDGTIDFFLGSAGSSNYGHWLVDDAPRIAGVIDHAIRTNIHKIRVFVIGHNAAIDDIRKQSIRSLTPKDIHIDCLMLERSKLFLFEKLFYVSPNTRHPALKSPASMARLRHMAVVGSDPGSPKLASRLFVIRRPARGREIVNINQIELILHRHGFETVDTESMNFDQQATLFSRALFVVGQMGAAMTNTVFSQPGCTVLHLAPEGWNEPFYWNLVSTCNQNYAVVFGPICGQGDTPHQSSFMIDPTMLSQALNDLNA